MIDETALRHAFADFAEALLQHYDIGHVLYRLTDQAGSVLGVDGAGVSLREGPDTLQFVTATDGRSSRVEMSQLEVGDGPCYEAFRTGEVVVIDDVETDDRWPAFRGSALEEGFRSVAGIPMPVWQERIGALNLYRTTAGGWTEDELGVAQLLANVASGYVFNWRTLDEHQTLAQQLQHALDSRVVIEQAKGVLAERHGVDAGEAFQLLRKHARSNSMRLHAAAAEVVSGDLQL